MTKSPNWSQEELSILKEKYPKLGRCQELRNLFPTRTIEGICLKANRIGLRVENNIRIGRTNKEYIELLTKTNFTCLEAYKGSTVPILHKCNLCNNEWNTRPQHALKKGANCPVCDMKNRVLSVEEVDKVLYEAGLIRNSEYLGSLDPINLTHISCGHTWDTVYSYIQQGSGCPLCNKGFGYSISKENIPETAYLYLLKITTSTEIFLKIGVTSRLVSTRVNELKSKINTKDIEILHKIKDSGHVILKKENYILNDYSLNKYVSDIDFSGKTEILHIDNDIDYIIFLMEEINE